MKNTMLLNCKKIFQKFDSSSGRLIFELPENAKGTIVIQAGNEIQEKIKGIEGKITSEKLDVVTATERAKEEIRALVTQKKFDLGNDENDKFVKELTLKQKAAEAAIDANSRERYQLIYKFIQAENLANVDLGIAKKTVADSRQNQNASGIESIDIINVLMQNRSDINKQITTISQLKPVTIDLTKIQAKTLADLKDQLPQIQLELTRYISSIQSHVDSKNETIAAVKNVLAYPDTAVPPEGIPQREDIVVLNRHLFELNQFKDSLPNDPGFNPLKAKIDQKINELTPIVNGAKTKFISTSDVLGTLSRDYFNAKDEKNEDLQAQKSKELRDEGQEIDSIFQFMRDSDPDVHGIENDLRTANFVPTREQLNKLNKYYMALANISDTYETNTIQDPKFQSILKSKLDHVKTVYHGARERFTSGNEKLKQASDAHDQAIAEAREARKKFLLADNDPKTSPEQKKTLSDELDKKNNNVIAAREKITALSSPSAEKSEERIAQVEKPRQR